MAFDKNFLWCVGGAAAQQDGGYLDGGKGLNIWDALGEGHIKNNENCHVACDHYHRWKDDVKLLKEMGVNSYRFSVSLARIYPTDEFTVNEEGVKFYIDLVNELKTLGIEPICTLYHWDLPLWLHRIGGWKNAKSVDWFERFTETMVNALSDKVKYWITFNEPQCFVRLGYYLGMLAPWEKNCESEIENISRNVMLAHGRAVKVIRDKAKITPMVGFAPTAGGLVTPSPVRTEQQAYDHTFAPRGSGSAMWWSDPIVLGKKWDGCDWLSDDDLKIICQPLDFYAFNIYVSANPEETECAGAPLTTMGWNITPPCLYWSAKFFHKRYGLPILITENGMANMDFVYDDGKVHDPQRIEYLRAHIRWLKKANDEGVPVIGYSCWCFMDNFEWAEGYEKRFGLVYVDYNTQERILKDSAYAYRDIIQSNGENL